ncbi:MAG: hypothetical protein A3H97_22900 [Acidobacteria bacterium RIFCSPLOWO2_02_FULL_65_29]|nr:MAG: hypothetical protein A3H97_22900 [Acidobacteria bacterium RIFCSPLOWO2_02_FULL_65_29]
MAKKGRAHDEEAWRNAKKVCRLNARQVEMARVLVMNPKKLPGLRPNPRQRWKLPVGGSSNSATGMHVRRRDPVLIADHCRYSIACGREHSALPRVRRSARGHARVRSMLAPLHARHSPMDMD